MSHIYISHIFTYNPVSEYQHLTSVGEGSILILAYNPVSELTHIFDQFKKYLMSHISQKKNLYNVEQFT